MYNVELNQCVDVFIIIRVKGAKEIKPKFLPTAIMFEGLKPITRKFDYKTQKAAQRCKSVLQEIRFIKNS